MHLSFGEQINFLVMIDGKVHSGCKFFECVQIAYVMWNDFGIFQWM